MRSQMQVEVCKPKNPDHRRGLRWLSSIVRAVEVQNTEEKKSWDPNVLKHSLQLYKLFVESGDQRYLRLSEDFLSASLSK